MKYYGPPWGLQLGHSDPSRIVIKINQANLSFPYGLQIWSTDSFFPSLSLSFFLAFLFPISSDTMTKILIGKPGIGWIGWIACN